MNFPGRYFSKRSAITFIKISIGIVCVLLIGQRLYATYSEETLGSIKEMFTAIHAPMLITAFLLLFFNWGLEVLKWNIITSPFEKISFSSAWQSVWAGVCIGNLTPGRVGEFAGRILFFSPPVRPKIAATHFVCGMTQLLVTIIAGCSGLIFFRPGMDRSTYYFLLMAGIILLLVLCFLLSRINKIMAWLGNKSAFRKFNFREMAYKTGTLVKLVGLSVIRHMVFTLQFYFLLKTCDIRGDFVAIISSIVVMYLLLSTIPMISFIEVAVRAFIAGFLFHSFLLNEWQLLVASTMLWFINIAIPSLVGYLFLLQNKFSIKESKNAVA